MWDMIMSLFGSGEDQNMMGNAYDGKMDDYKDPNDLTQGMGAKAPELSTMDKMGQFGKEQFNSAFSPYKNGIDDLKNIYGQFKAGNGLLGTTQGSTDPTALSSLGRLFSNNGLLGGKVEPDSPAQMNMLQNNNLGLPRATIQMTANPQPQASSLARQAMGRYY